MGNEVLSSVWFEIRKTIGGGSPYYFQGRFSI